MLTVTDDGTGFDPESPEPGHLVQHTMRERMNAVGGTVRVDSRRGHGTVVTAQVPALRHPADS